MSEMEVQPVAVEAPGLSQWQRVACSFSAPTKTFADIQRGNRSWWLPFLIFVVIGYLFFAAVDLKIGMQQVVTNQIHLKPAQEEQMAQAPPDQRERSMAIAVGVTEGVFIAQPLILLAVIAVLSVGLWGTINFVFGGRANFGSIFTTWMYASLPGVLKPLLGIVVIFSGIAPESFDIKNSAPTNPGAFLDPSPPTRRSTPWPPRSMPSPSGRWCCWALAQPLWPASSAAPATSQSSAGGPSSCSSAWASQRSWAEKALHDAAKEKRRAPFWMRAVRVFSGTRSERLFYSVHRRRTSEALIPPKPNEFDRAMSKL